MINKKGQSAVEFSIFIGVLLFFTLIVLIIVNASIIDKTNEQIDLQVSDIALQVVDEVNLAYSSSDGYSRTFALPRSAGPLDYNVSIVDSNVYVITEDGKHAISLPVGNVTGSISSGNNTISRSNGTVLLNS